LYRTAEVYGSGFSNRSTLQNLKPSLQKISLQSNIRLSSRYNGVLQARYETILRRQNLLHAASLFPIRKSFKIETVIRFEVCKEQSDFTTFHITRGKAKLKNGITVHWIYCSMTETSSRSGLSHDRWRLTKENEPHPSTGNIYGTSQTQPIDHQVMEILQTHIPLDSILSTACNVFSTTITTHSASSTLVLTLQLALHAWAQPVQIRTMSYFRTLTIPASVSYGSNS